MSPERDRQRYRSVERDQEYDKNGFKRTELLPAPLAASLSRDSRPRGVDQRGGRVTITLNLPSNRRTERTEKVDVRLLFFASSSVRSGERLAAASPPRLASRNPAPSQHCRQGYRSGQKGRIVIIVALRPVIISVVPQGPAHTLAGGVAGAQQPAPLPDCSNRRPISQDLAPASEDDHYGERRQQRHCYRGPKYWPSSRRLPCTRISAMRGTMALTMRRERPPEVSERHVPGTRPPFDGKAPRTQRSAPAASRAS